MVLSKSGQDDARAERAWAKESGTSDPICKACKIVERIRGTWNCSVIVGLDYRPSRDQCIRSYIHRSAHLDTCRRPDQGSILTTARGALSSRRPHPAPTTPASSVHILCNFLIAITHFRRHRGRRGSRRLQTGGISPCEHRGRLQLGEICRGP